ncbi:11325_t:CDS:2 [Diversispora eburnea]|uniref:11325_t:CDS:1 n=1 Tax=Diversispora eburnea TaxID=1213867 RepID=A0A9N9GIX5_9GLOM|nr:11325_t:CDS:2 [Diversispora eburnea]
MKKRATILLNWMTIPRKSNRMNSDDAPEQIVSQRDDTPIFDISDNASSSDVCQKLETRKSLED